MVQQIVRGPLLMPHGDGSVAFHADGALTAEADGTIAFSGPWEALGPQFGQGVPTRRSTGVMLPPLLDVHTHVPQHPVRGRFVEGIAHDAPGGQLLAGLRRNIFPAEAHCNGRVVAERVVRAFLADTLSHGVVGGAAYMTPSSAATEVALSILPAHWSVGLVLMDQRCPPELCTEALKLDADVAQLASRFGNRLIITDRFAVAVSAPLRRRGSALAEKHGLRTQTHLNEQRAEKALVEQVLYPDALNYTDVYQRDGLLDHHCIAAHCVQMTEPEWQILRGTGTAIAHCPTSNLLLGSGVMPLDEVMTHGIPYAIATDVAASPTVSMLAEMARFLDVHEGRSTAATPSEALFRSTRAPADIIGLRLGRLEPGWPMSFIEVEPVAPLCDDADAVIRALLPADLDAPARAVCRVTLAGKTMFERPA